MMPAMKVTCPTCQQAINLEGSKLPGGRVSFSCPGCGGQVVLDRSSSPESTPKPAAAAPSVAPAHSAPSAKAHAGERPVHGPRLPSGVVISDDPALTRDLQQRFAELGSTLQPASSASEVRALPPEELPALIIFAAGSVARPPVEDLRPLTGMGPIDRRRTFIVLLAADVGTMDGNSAFVFDVNMTVNRSDLRKLPSILHAALEHHRRLYRRFNEAVEAAGR